MNSSRLTLARRSPVVTAIAGLIVIVLLSLSACSGGDDEESSTVSIAQGVDPTTMDPVNQRETTTENIVHHLYDPLINMDVDDPSSFTPALAESYEQVDDTTYEFSLRKGVTFSDGTELDAADVVYTIDYLIGKLTKTPPLRSSFFPDIKDAKAVDDLTVQVTTKAPSPLFLANLASVYIIPEDADFESLASTPIGTGPYTLDSWERNASVTLSARDDYWGGAPAITTVTFETIADDSSRLAALNSGDVDIVTGLSPDNKAEVESSGVANVQETPSARILTTWLNTQIKGPMQNGKVRQALNHAIDVDTIIDTVMSGYGKRVATFTPDYFFGYDAANKPLDYDPELAKKLLSEAGYKDGFEMEMLLPTGRFPFAEETAQAMQQYLAEVGVTLKLDVVEFGVYADKTNSGDVPEAFLASYGNGTFNPLGELQIAARSGGSAYALYKNKGLDTLIDKASRTVDPEKSKKLLSRIEKDLLEQAPFIYMNAQVDLYGVSNRLDWKPRTDEQIYMYDAALSS